MLFSSTGLHPGIPTEPRISKWVCSPVQLVPTLAYPQSRAPVNGVCSSVQLVFTLAYPQSRQSVNGVCSPVQPVPTLAYPKSRAPVNGVCSSVQPVPTQAFPQSQAPVNVVGSPALASSLSYSPSDWGLPPCEISNQSDTAIHCRRGSRRSYSPSLLSESQRKM